MISYNAIVKEVRRRVIDSADIDPNTQFSIQNMNYSMLGTGLFIAEFSIGGTEQMISVKRSRISSFLIQYDFYAPLNSGMEKLESAIERVLAEFDLADREKSNVSVDGLDIVVKSIKRDGETLRDYRREKLLFTLDVISG